MLKSLKEFFRLEAASGILLMVFCSACSNCRKLRFS